MTGLLLAGGALAGSSVLAYAARGRSSTLFGPNVWRGPENQRALALTFDDGPSESTPALLDILASHQVRATFFQVGLNVERLPDIASQVAAAGHEIGNHSLGHRLMVFRSRAFVQRELIQAQERIHHATGYLPKLYRAPFGVRWFGLAPVLRELHLTGVMWSTIGCDWKLPAAGVVKRLRQGLTHGAILCLHDGRELHRQPDITPTLEAVRRFVPQALARGYRFVTVSELICQKT